MLQAALAGVVMGLYVWTCMLYKVWHLGFWRNYALILVVLALDFYLVSPRRRINDAKR
jgi:hypothetical protein